MSPKLQMPLLLPTIGFIVGSVVSHNLGLGVVAPLIIVLMGGILFVWRGWSVALLAIAIGVGGVRVSMEERSNLEAQPKISVVKESKIIGDLRQSALRNVASLELSKRAERLVSAMVLGDKSGIDWGLRREYGLAGASHLLAVSGLHLSVIFLLLNCIFMPLVLLPRGHILRSVLVLVVAWIYAAVVGFTPSVVRSVGMFSLLQVAWSLGRQYGGMNTLLCVLLCSVVVSPSILYNLGFQLSVISVAAIFLWALPLYREFFGGGGVFISALCLGAACGLATMPIVSYTFGYVPVLGLIMSPLYVLCATAIILFGVVWALLPLGFIAPPIRVMIEIVSMLLDNSVEWVASQGWGVLMWRASGLEVGIIYLIYVLITALIWFRDETPAD